MSPLLMPLWQGSVAPHLCKKKAESIFIFWQWWQKAYQFPLPPQFLGELLGHVWTEMPVESAVIHAGHRLPVDKNVVGTWLDFIFGEVLVLSQFLIHSSAYTGLKTVEGCCKCIEPYMKKKKKKSILILHLSSFLTSQWVGGWLFPFSSQMWWCGRNRNGEWKETKILTPRTNMLPVPASELLILVKACAFPTFEVK